MGQAKKMTRPPMAGERGRKHPPGKIERAGAEAAVNEVLMNGGTLKEACGRFREFTGETVSLDSMSRYRMRLYEHYAKMEKLDVLVDRLLDRAAEAPGKDPAALTREMLLALAMEAAEAITPEAMAALSPGELSLLLARLERTRTARDLVRLGYIRTALAAKRQILKDSDEEVARDPGLARESELVDQEERAQRADEKAAGR